MRPRSCDPHRNAAFMPWRKSKRNSCYRFVHGIETLSGTHSSQQTLDHVFTLCSSLQEFTPNTSWLDIYTFESMFWNSAWIQTVLSVLSQTTSKLRTCSVTPTCFMRPNLLQVLSVLASCRSHNDTVNPGHSCQHSAIPLCFFIKLNLSQCVSPP